MATSRAQRPTDVRDTNLVARRFEIEPFDPWEILAAVPRHKSYRLFAEPDGPLTLGVGAAARVARGPGVKHVRWSLLLEALRASLGDTAGFARVLFSAAFDTVEPFDDGWRGFAPVELCVPDITFERHDGLHTMTVIAAARSVDQIVESGRAILRGAKALERPTAERSIAWRDDAYASVVERALERISAGDAEKIVVARPIEVEQSSPLSPSCILENLEERFPACFLFAHRPGGSHRGASPTFLGATPERLVRVEGRRVQTGAIAGTAPRGVSARMDQRHAQQLLTSEKEMREHEAVGQMIVEALGEHCSDVERESVRFLKLANVQHLWSPIRGDLLGDRGILDVAQSLHPTPAVGGTPRDVAIDAIREIEPWTRGLYAGVFGTLGLDGTGELAVAIRSALVDGNHARIYAGAGIVAGSRPESEAEETRAKATAILDAMEAP